MKVWKRHKGSFIRLLLGILREDYPGKRRQKQLHVSVWKELENVHIYCRKKGKKHGTRRCLL